MHLVVRTLIDGDQVNETSVTPKKFRCSNPRSGAGRQPAIASLVTTLDPRVLYVVLCYSKSQGHGCLSPLPMRWWILVTKVHAAPNTALRATSYKITTYLD